MRKIDDPQRLAALQRSGLMRHGEHDRLVRLCYTVTELLDVDASQINVVTGQHQIFIAEWPRARRLPLDLADSGCREVVLGDGMVIVEDALSHPIMCQMPWTASWRGYMGAPLHFDGETIGAICALTVDQRTWSMIDQVNLEGLAALAETTIALGMSSQT